MNIRDLTVPDDSVYGDSSRCQTHRIKEIPDNIEGQTKLNNADIGCGEFLPKVASWRPSKVVNNSVVIHRPIRSIWQNYVTEKVSTVKSADRIPTKDLSNRFPGHKSTSEVQLGRAKTERSSGKTSKYCHVDPVSESDDETSLTVRNEFITLDTAGFYDSNESLRLSLTSLESSTQEDQEVYEIARREAFNEWLARKEKERRESSKKTDEKDKNHIKLSPAQREELFKKWIENKKLIKEAEKARKLAEKKKEEEKKKQSRIGKEEKLKDWCKRKEQSLRESQLREKSLADEQARAKEQKKKESEEAYQKWLKNAKNKPLPVPLNKGELSMRGSISSMYVNPKPWILTTEGDENSSTSS